MKPLLLALLTLALTTSLIQAQNSPANTTGYFPGVNLSGAEFGDGNTLGKNFVYPNEEEFAYFQKKGLKIIRIPFKWERIQPKLLGELDPENLKELDRCVSQANRHGLIVLLDVHNYAGCKVDGKNQLIGTPELSGEKFNDLWGKLATHYKDHPLVWFGLMNEPHQQTAQQTAEIMQAAVSAIRGTGAKNKILVPGTSWTGAHSWISSGNGAAYENFTDPENNFAFEVHQYLDKDNSGTHAEVVAGSGSTRLAAFTAWARQHHFKGFLGEAGWDGKTSNPQANAEGDALLGYMDQNKDVWIGYTYWAAGPWWGSYMYSIEPTGLKTSAPTDANQLSVVLKHLQ